MIDDPIRSAFEHIDEDASDEFRDALHARLLAELVGHDASGQDEPSDVVTHMSSDAQSTSGRRLLITVAAAAIVLMMVGALMLVARDDAREPQVPAAPPADPSAGGGLIAFSGGTGESRAESDTEIYVVAPDGTGLRALTSTPGVPEVAPAWSPDGTRLAFLRNEREGGVELVVIDPATGDETFSVDLPIPPPSHGTVPPKWSPDGRLIVVPLHSLGGLAVDLETGTWTTFPGSYRGWSPSGTMSPDGKWFVTPQEGDVVPDRLFLVPADLVGTISDFDDITQLPGVRPLVERDGATPVTWMPDSSAVAISLVDGSIDVVTIADGQRRTLIEDGFGPSWSPDGSHIAYLRCLDGPDPVDMPPDTVPADLAGVAPRQSGASVWVAAADGTGARAVATSLVPPMWSPDGSLLIVGDDGLFTVRPDGTGMTRLTRVMTPKKSGAYAGLTACGENVYPWLAVVGWFGPVFQPMSPSADVGAAVANTDATETMPARVTTDVIATEASATTDGGLMIIDTANDGSQPRVPADQSTTSAVATSRHPSSYVLVGDAFMDAWVAGDAPAQIALIADPSRPGDTRIGGRWATPIRDEADLHGLADWFQALGWDFQREACHYLAEFWEVPPTTDASGGGEVFPEVTDSASVWCDYTYENDLTRADGRAPVQGHFGITVAGDHIFSVSTEMFELDAEIWQALYDWLSRTHPEDVPAMYDWLTTSPTPRFDSASIALWQRHVDEFVSSSESTLPWPMPPTRAQFGATARAICAAAAENARGDLAPFFLELPPASVLAQASQDAMEQLRSLPRPNEDRSEIDQLFVLLEQVNERVVADDWFKQNDFYDIQHQKNTLGGDAFHSCPVGPLGG